MIRGSALATRRWSPLSPWREANAVWSRLTALSLASFLCFAGGCAVSTRSEQGLDPKQTASPRPDGDATAFTLDGQSPVELARLARLWQRRTQAAAVSDHPIGPGDVLEISVPAMEELRDRMVRVSGEGTIALPFLGVLRAAGLTEAELGDTIRRGLHQYMYKPQVTLFVREYRSRQVAVIGAVAKPGLYSLASGADTILDMIAAAGGMTGEAAPRILFIPVEPAEAGNPHQIPPPPTVQLVSRDASPLPAQRTDPILLDLKALARGGHQIYLTLPARPGDVLLVPGGGQVLVQGWVEKPGSYKVTPGLTVLGAVAAAGGPLYPADTTSVRVIRTGKEGNKIFTMADLERIKRGEEPDISVQEGDVVEINSSAPKLVPYGFYRFFSSVLNVGLGASVPVR